MNQNQTLRSLVLGIGALDGIDPHLGPALRLAEAQGATLHVVHAYRLPDPLLYPYPEMGTYNPELTAATQQAVQQRLEEQVAGVGSPAKVECRTVPGPADVAILDVAEEVGADLIVVGATERGTLSRTILGTTAGRVLRASAVPVLVSRRPESGLVRRVLMTTDLSELSGRVYQRALPLVGALGGVADLEVRTLLVVGYDLANPAQAQQSVLREITEKELRPFLQKAAPEAPVARGKVRLGDPATEIRAEVEEWNADLLVVGTHGRGGISRFLIGSVAEAVVRQSQCDVLVVPAAAVAAGDDEPESST